MSRKASSRREKRRWSWEWGLLLLIVLGGGLLAYELPMRSMPRVSGVELAHQIVQAAKGVVPPARRDGIVVKAVTIGGETAVTAENVTPKLCVSAGWDLAKDGTLTVNGITPLRVSAGKLAELCNASQTATLTWMPDEKE